MKRKHWLIALALVMTSGIGYLVASIGDIWVVKDMVTKYWYVNTQSVGGHIVPGSDDSYQVGTSSLRPREVYTSTAVPNFLVPVRSTHQVSLDTGWYPLSGYAVLSSTDGLGSEYAWNGDPSISTTAWSKGAQLTLVWESTQTLVLHDESQTAGSGFYLKGSTQNINQYEAFDFTLEEGDAGLGWMQRQ